MSYTGRTKKGIKSLQWGISLSIIGALVVLLAGYGYQWGWWHFRLGFQMIPWATGTTVVGGLITTFGFIRAKKTKTTLTFLGSISVIIALGALFNIGYWYLEVEKGYPPIHDITTDIQNPPAFVAIAPLRAGAPNPVEYAGIETAMSQQSYYGDLSGIESNLPYDEAFDKALATVDEMPWTLVEANKENGRIEAYEKLAWFGFIDDVVIRVDTTSTGSIIDIRSKSRIGRGDLGVNYKRIEAYKHAFKK